MIIYDAPQQNYDKQRNLESWSCHADVTAS